MQIHVFILLLHFGMNPFLCLCKAIKCVLFLYEASANWLISHQYLAYGVPACDGRSQRTKNNAIGRRWASSSLGPKEIDAGACASRQILLATD